MKAPFLLPSVLSLLLTVANVSAFDWLAAAKDPGTVEVTNMSLRTLEPGNEDKASWSAVPGKLRELHAQVFKSPRKDNSGIVEYRVTKDGWVLVAGHFGNEGSKGDWLAARSRLTYDYFQRRLTDEQRYRDNIAKALDKLFPSGPGH